MDISEVKEWLVEEMKYDKELPSDDELRLLCSAGMLNVWSHFIGNCRSLETVKKIKGNLTIAKKRQSHVDNSKSMSIINISVRDGGERDELLAERSLLTSKLHETKSKIESLKVGLRSVEDERRSVHKNKEEYLEAIQKKRLSSALLALYTKKVEHVKKEIDAMDRAQEKIEENLKNKKKLTKEARVYSVGSSVEMEGDRKLRFAVEKAMSHMQTIIKGDNPGSRKDLRSEIVGVLKEMSGSSLEKALSKSIQNQITHVAELRKKLNLLEEANNMKLETGLEGGGIVSSVREEVDNLYMKHINAQENLKKAKKSVLNHEKELESVLEINRENISNMKELEVELAGAREAAVLEFKKGEVHALQELLCQLVGRRENLQEIINWVKGAENNIQETTEIISALISSNLQGNQKLVSRQTVAEELINELPVVLKGLNGSLHKAVDEPSNMLKTFLQVPVDRFCSTVVEGKHETTLIPSPDLGIYRLRNYYPYPSQVGDLNSESLLVSQTSRQDLPSQASQLIADVQGLKQEFQDLERSESESLLPSLRQLLDKLKQSKLQQVKDFKPLLKGTESCRVDGMEVCGRVEEGLEEWTGQGARAVLERDEEMLVEGRTLQQWQEALRVATANTKS